MRIQGWTLQLLACLILFSQTQAATATVLNFDGLSDGDIVTSQFAGVTFSNTIVLTAGISLNEFEFPPHSNFNVVSDNGGAISISFASPTSAFGGYFTYTVPLTLRAFNSASTQVGQAVSLFGNNLALSGEPGSSPNELLQVISATGIARVTITGDPLEGSFVLDDATFELLATGVPEPGTGYLLLTAGAMAFVWLRKTSQLS